MHHSSFSKSHFSVTRRNIFGGENSTCGKRRRTETTTMMAPLDSSSNGENEDLFDQLRTLLRREGKYARYDYLGCFEQDARIVEIKDGFGAPKSDPSLFRRNKQSKTPLNKSVNSRSPVFTEHHRAQLCEWAVEVVNYYSFPKYSVEVAVNIFDRYMGKFVPPEERTMDTLHLLTLTSLYLALKLTTLQRPAAQIFVRLGRSKFSAGQVEETELIIMQGLGWHVNPPTAEEFALYYLQALSEVYPIGIIQALETSTLDSIHSTLSDYIWVQFPASAVAMGALAWALHLLKMKFPRQEFADPMMALRLRGVFVLVAETKKALEYFYLRNMYRLRAEANLDKLPSTQPKSAPRTVSGDFYGARNTSPVSIIKDSPAVIPDTED